MRRRLLLPIPLAREFPRTCAKHSRVSRTPWHVAHRYLLAGDLFCYLNDLADGMSLATSDVVDSDASSIPELQCRDVRMGDVRDVHVIPNTGPIRRGIVVTINFEVRPLSGSSLQQQRNNVCLGLMIFSGVLSRARGIEISKRNCSPPVGVCIPMQDSLEH